MCTAPPGGNPSCSGSGPASSGATGPSSGAGNPINLLNGNKYQEETDLAPLPGVLGLELKRYYNSQSSHAGLLGANWRMSYETVLYDFGHEIQIVQADGRRLMFQRGLGAAAALCTSAQPQDGQVRIEASRDGRAGPTYHWRWADGRTLTFSSGSGGGYPLQSIAAATGERVTLSYAPGGELTGIRDPQGRKLAFVYAGATAAERRGRFLKAIDTPLGRIGYTQDSLGRLTEVSQARDARSAPFVTRLYHYEDRYNAGHKTALTGISVKGLDPQTKQNVEQRLSTYAYDAQGLAVLSTKGVPREMKDGKQVEGTGIEQVEVEYLAKPLPQEGKVDLKSGEVALAGTGFGKAVLTNSLGQKTEVTSAVVGGHFRLVEMKGPGCSTCGPSDMRYAYDGAGLLKKATKLDQRGRPLRSEVTELDRYGRTARVGTQSYTDGKLQATRWTERYEYSDFAYVDGSLAVAPVSRPSLVARPSVISGKEHVVAMSYNEFGQLTELTESGYSPVDANAHPSPGGTFLSRTTTYTYRKLDGRSVVQRIDGSAGQADVTRFDWDSNGNFIAAVTWPGGLVTREQQDPASGRPTLRTDALGVDAHFEYTQATTDKPSLVERAGQTTSYHYDLLGRPVRIDQWGKDGLASSGAGDQRNAKSIELRYDAGGRLITVNDAQGYKAQTTLDSEGQPLVAGLYEPQQALPLRATYRWFDDHRRQSKQLQADGRIDTWTYDETGRFVSHVDGDHVLHLQRASAADVGVLIDLAPDGLARAAIFNDNESGGGAPLALDTPQVKRDDFGRVVIEWRPEQGLNLRTYDARDHLLIEDRIGRDAKPTGRVEQTFDAAGRMTRRQTFDPEGVLKETVERVYAGPLLKEERNDVQATAYDHDATGRVTAKRITLIDERGRPAYATTLRTRYDSQGEVEAKTLADGQVMRIERDAMGVARRISLQSVVWAHVTELLERWLPRRISKSMHGWLPSSMVADNVRFHPFNGITDYSSGNGIHTKKTFDIAGRVTNIQTGTIENRQFSYAAGPRIRAFHGELAGGAPLEAHFEYDGFGALKSDSLLGTRTIASSAPSRRIERDTRGRTTTDGTFRYTYTVNGQVETVDSVSGERVASYKYNAMGQRVSKSVQTRDGAPQVTLYLWSESRLVAEIEGEGEHKGQPSTQYLYLGNGGNAAPVAKIETAFAVGNRTGQPRILAVHADHRGAPTALTDAARNIVWTGRPDAWGFIVDQKTSAETAQKAVMNIRLPGQYFDSETRLHDNWHRTYDGRPDSPTKGSYLTPDPAGYPDGADPYTYVNGDPINSIDPKGLYQEDIHYYMTFFLALAAGTPYDAARTIAEAAQYVDDNPLTRPVENLPLTKVVNPLVALWNQEQLLRYHFTLSDHDSGVTADTYVNDEINIVIGTPSEQLSLLLNASEIAPSDCAKYQFFGEYLHAFEDTYSHRQKDNTPYNALRWGLGVGHGLQDGSEPDFTFDDPDKGWTVRSARTLAMEEAVFDKLVSFGGNGHTFEDIKETLVAFNRIQEYGGEGSFTEKVAILQAQLVKWNIRDANGDVIDLSDANGEYSQRIGADNRNRNLCIEGVRLRQSDYPGTLLPQSNVPC